MAEDETGDVRGACTEVTLAAVYCLQPNLRPPPNASQVAKLRPPRWWGSRSSGLPHQPPLLLQPAKQIACCMLLIYEVALRCIASSAKNGTHMNFDRLL
jgi:hypothetical protein